MATPRGNHHTCVNAANYTPLLFKYWLRLLEHDCTSLVYRSYIENLALLHEQSPCWIKTVKDILLTTGFEQEWYNQQVPCARQFVIDLEDKLKNIFDSQWRLDVFNDNRGVQGEGNKFRTYRMYKCDIKFEPYLKLRNPSLRKNLTSVTKYYAGLIYGYSRNRTLDYQIQNKQISKLFYTK